MKKIVTSIFTVLLICGYSLAADLKPGEEEFNKAVNFHDKEKYAKAFTEFQKGADKGFSSCFTWMGIYYLEGLSVNKNIDRGFDLVKKGADMGSPMGLTMIGDIYTFGLYGVTQNIPLGLIYLERAISTEDPNPIAFFSMGEVYANGIGVEKNIQKAIEMYEKADALGAPMAKYAINELKNPAVGALILMNEVEQNQLRFDKTYNNKSITILGYVGEIEAKNNGYELRVLGKKSDNNPSLQIECRFTEEQEDMLLKLNKNDVVKVKGMYKGKQKSQVGKLVLFDCTIVE